MSVCFRQAEVADIPSMMALWSQCFPEDDIEYVREFFARTPINTGFIACKGEVLSMLFLLPAQVDLAARTFPVRYLYAGCTHPAFRRQGLYEQLLLFAAEQAVNLGACAIYLHPATDELVPYYQRCGYRNGIGCWSDRSKAVTQNTIPVCAPSDYLAHRTEWLRALPIVWRLSPPYEAYFFNDMLQDGWVPYADLSGCGLVAKDGLTGYDCHGAPITDSTLGSVDRGEWHNTAMWLPIGDCAELLSVMESQRAYTAFMGEF